jgi:cell division FtsZ-interacting protein ZapD
MSVFDSYTRDQLRQTYADAWRKHLAHSLLTPLEAMIVDVIAAHPEYQAMVSDRDTAVGLAPGGSGSAENPFLHMGLHLAVREQVSIDRPPGVRELHRLLHARDGDPHRAEHVLMEALGETLWQAQRAGRAPDEVHYLALARQRLEAYGGH